MDEKSIKTIKKHERTRKYRDNIKGLLERLEMNLKAFNEGCLKVKGNKRTQQPKDDRVLYRANGEPDPTPEEIQERIKEVQEKRNGKTFS